MSLIELQEGEWDGTTPPAWCPQFATPYVFPGSFVREPDLVFYMNRRAEGLHGVFERYVGGGVLETDYPVQYPIDSPWFPVPDAADCEY